MSRCFIDHITVTAPSLEVGAKFVREVLGASPQAGGEHPRMGTHNRLLRLGESCFLEVIAVNPAAPAPGRPRWFALDALTPQSAPGLAMWVVRSKDIRATLSGSSEALGNVEPMSRGALDWLISIPSDGSLPMEGLAPTVIEWSAAGHPAAKLIDYGLQLIKLELFSPQPERLDRLLRSLEVEAPVSVQAASVAGLVAHVRTPQGIRLLSSPLALAPAGTPQ